MINRINKVLLNKRLHDCLLFNHRFDKASLLERRDELNWDILINNESIDWSLSFFKEVLPEVKNKFRRNEILKNNKIAINDKIIVEYFDDFNQKLLFQNASINWTEYLLNQLKGRLSIENISHNLNIPKQAFRENKNRINWKGVSFNSAAVIENDFLIEFEEFVDWKNISHNQKGNWKQIDISRFAHRWDWTALCKNPKVNWCLFRSSCATHIGLIVPL